MRALIVGCGYIGIPLGTELVRLGHEVVGVRRTSDAGAELRALGIQPIGADITRPEEIRRLRGPFDWVVNCVSSSRGGIEEYRQVFLTGTRNLLEWLREVPPRRFVYTSSTGVYGQTDGSAVSETSPTEPSSDTSRILVQTEKLLLDAAREQRFPSVILRAAGIYGPGRGHLFLKFLRGEARIPEQGERLINMIHRDDLVGCLVAALSEGRTGEIYNAADDRPVTQIEFFRWLSRALGRSMPPFAVEKENSARKRGVTNKRVLNEKLKRELGYQFKYPTFIQGYWSEIQRLRDAGELNALSDESASLP